MLVKNILLCSTFFTTIFAFSQSTQTIGSTTVTIDTLTDNMLIPWEIKVEGDDYLWVTEREGRVSRVDLQTGAKTIILDITTTVYSYSESGLLGLTLHPDFPNTPEVFLVYTYDSPSDTNGYFRERLVKYTFNGTDLVNPQILIDNILAWDNHNGSRLHILPDNTILMSTGECYIPELAQDSSALNGKYLRVNMDGSIPGNNPIPNSYIYTMGHRNSQGICALPNGKIIISEHGPTTDDELQILEMGKNYGWPMIHGFCDESFEDAPCATGLYQEPIHNWTPTIATSDLVFYDNEFFPEWHNRVIMVTLNGQRVVAMQLNGDESAVSFENQYLQGQFGRLRDIAIGPNKEIYIATNTGNDGHPIIRITPPNSAGLGELASEQIKIVPNPSKDEIQLIFGDNVPLNFAVLDLNGQTVLKMESIVSGQSVNLSDLDAATYFIELTNNDNGQKMRQKFIKL